MNASILWIIILGIWIWILQNRIRNLEKMVYRLKNAKDANEGNVASVEIKTSEKTPLEDKLPVETETAVSNVKIFTQTYSEPVEKEPSRMVAFFTNYFTQGNLLVRIGGVVLFFGLAFLVKYAAEHSLISIEVRLASIALAGLVLIGIGWKLKEREGAYGQILQGLGIAMLYLVIFAAAKFYALIPLEMAFVLMLAVVVLGSGLAVKENALPLALFATGGGFLVPILTSSGQGSHIILFSYYAFLNVGIFIVAWYRSWRILNVVGFFSTFVIATFWGVLRYKAELFGTTEPFLILYFLMYLGISILFTFKHPFKPYNFVDGTLVFGLPLIAFPLQVEMVKTMVHGEAYSAVVLGTVYVLLFSLLKSKERTQLLSQAFLALGVVFYTIAIPYYFDADVSAALWSLEASAILWIALKQSRAYARYFSEFLLLVSIAVYPLSVYSNGISWVEYFGYVIVIVSSLIASYLLGKYRKQLSGLETLFPVLLLSFAILLWFSSTPLEFERFDMLHGNALMASLVLGGLLLFITTKLLKWELLVDTLQGYLLLGVLFFLARSADTVPPLHPFEGFGSLVLGSLIVLNYTLLFYCGKVWKYTKELHILSLWFIAAVGTLELRYQAAVLDRGESVIVMATAIIPLLFSLGIMVFKRYPLWLEKYRDGYKIIGAGGLVSVLILWEFRAFLIAPDMGLSFYFPLFNLLDMMQVLVLAMFGYWTFANKKLVSQETHRFFLGVLFFSGTMLASVIFARAVHIFRDIDYRFIILWENVYFQAGLSILWSVIAIVMMLLSKRYTNRIVWMSGFGLLILVVLKLFFIELANSGTIERIISFIVVGSLLLLIGYFVPLPPDEKEKSENEVTQKK